MKVEILSLLLLIAGSGALPADETASPAGESPSLELLEFLGDFETPEGEWFDPMRLKQTQDEAKPKVTGNN